MSEQSGLTRAEFNLDYEDLHLDERRRIRVIRREPQIEYPMHSHSAAELVIVTAGSGLHRSGRAVYPVSAGHVFSIFKGQAHAYEELKNLHLINILFESSILRQPVLELGKLNGYRTLFTAPLEGEEAERIPSKLDPWELDGVVDIVERMEAELRGNQPGDGFMASMYMGILVGVLSRIASPGLIRGSRNTGTLAPALELMEQRPEENISIQSLCAVTGLSAATLNRQFRRETGDSPHAHHMKLKMKRASELLRRSRLSITEIAGRCGFDDANHFSRQFKRTVGMPPSRYRRRCRN